MNIHPLFVHFPIALLTLYALFEIFIPIKIRAFKLLKKENTVFYKWLIDPVWNSIKAFLVIAGTLIAFPTLQTGELAEEVFRDAATSPELFHQSQVAQLIEVHSTFANITVGIFAVLAVAYIVRIVWSSWVIENLFLLKSCVTSCSVRGSLVRSHLLVWLL